MSVWGVIPARYASSRFPGKPLVKILDKELLAWVIHNAKKSRLLDHLVVATDDERIAAIASKEKVPFVMTDSDLASGSDRVWAAIEKEKVETVINIQGDEPLITGQVIDSLIHPMLAQPELDMATLAHPLSEEDLHSEHAVKVIVNQNNDAVYFSRFPIPFSRQKLSETNKMASFRHIGLYAYRAGFLKRYCKQPCAVIELAESLEQLRALYMGAKIKVVLTNERSLGVDTPEDIDKVEQALMRLKEQSK